MATYADKSAEETAHAVSYSY